MKEVGGVRDSYSEQQMWCMLPVQPTSKGLGDTAYTLLRCSLVVRFSTTR
jgi:hypothetical protein